jgi:transposase InsO family protein
MEVLAMPWKEVNVMNQKLEFVLKSFRKEKSFTDLCTEYCITAKTGYKWKERFLLDGIEGLKEKPRKPRSSPTHFSEDVICELIRIKKTKLRWGPKKIREVYTRNHPHERIPARSTVERILKKAGFVDSRKRRRKINPERIQERIVPLRPNDVWTVDFKGWWYTKEREKCEPLTVRDEFSKYIFSIAILEKADISSVKREFEHIFKLHGLPKMIRSDNGPPFASHMSIHGLTRLSAWWLSLGIKLDRIDPGSPQQNGAHERMHLDIKKELEGKIAGSLKMHQQVFNVWRKEFNEERPHESLAMKTPAAVYANSDIKYDCSIDLIEYPRTFKSRQVNDRGYINHLGRRIFITNALGGYNVGLKKKNNSYSEVWFNSTLLGEIDLNSFMFISILEK